MAAPIFVTLPDDAKSGLQGLAIAMLDELKMRGYKRIKSEPGDISLPGTPTFSAQREHETLYVLVRHRLKSEEIQRWVLYARSCPNDTRVAVCAPENSSILKRLSELQEKGVGVFRPSSSGFAQVLSPRDLAFPAQPPDRRSLRPKVRRLLGAALDKYENGDWRDGFETACVMLETECRAYLLKNRRVRPGRVTYLNKKGVPTTPTELQIDRMTLGALKDVFCQMTMPTPADSQLCAALSKLNRDRIGKVHHPTKKRIESALRKRVGRHFFLIGNALALLV